MTATDRRALEDEREFCLRSLRDLEAERAAGDIDEADYEQLRDDYTRRAATVLRRLSVVPLPEPDSPALPEPGSGSPAEGPPASRRRWSRRRRALCAAGAVVVAAGAGIGVAAGTGVRLPGQTITGNTTGVAAIDQELIAAQKAVESGDPVAAAKDYQKVLAVDATNPSALTGEGAILVETDRATLVGRGVVMLAEAESADPSYGPAYAYLGRGLVLLGDYARAVKQLETFIADDRSSALVPQARKLLAYAKAKAATGPTSPG